MSQYAPITGRILQIDGQSAGYEQAGCGMTLMIDTMDQGIVNMNLDGSTYVLHNRRLNAGDFVTCFYSLFAPVPLIFPPVYRAVAIAHTDEGGHAVLDVFTQSYQGGHLINSDHSLVLNVSGRTSRILPNGQFFGGSLSGKLLLATYGATTRSIPAQATPDVVVVFCGGTL